MVVLWLYVQYIIRFVTELTQRGWHTSKLDTIHEHQDFIGTVHRATKETSARLWFISTRGFLSHHNRSCPGPQRELQSSLADFSPVFCELRSREHARNKETRIPYFYVRVLKPGGGNAGPTDLTLPLRPLPRPQRTGQGLKDEKKHTQTHTHTDLEQIMAGSRNTSPTLWSAITNQLYDQLLLNYQINQVNQPRSFTLVI